jgi:hypothetical protein
VCVFVRVESAFLEGATTRRERAYWRAFYCYPHSRIGQGL